jgi:hypothetical protein
MTGGTIQLINSQTVSVGSTSFTGGTVEYTGTGTYTQLRLGATYYNLLISGSGSFTPAANVDINGSFTQTAGTFIVSPSGLTVADDFTHTAGVFTPGSNTITFDDSTQISSISGTTTFYNLTSITPGKTLRFASNSTTTVSNALTLRGNSTNLLILESTDEGYPWHLDVDGTATLSHLDVSDSNACPGTTQPLVATGSTDSGNNYCWSISGGFTDWYTSAWTRRKALTINSRQVIGSHTDFPVMIRLDSDAGLASLAQDDGDDILFTSEDGATKLSHEIEYFDGDTGELVAWIKVPALTEDIDTRIFMYYGHGSIENQEDIENVWDNNFVMVQHLEETTTGATDFTDSTGNNNDSVSVTIDGTGSNPDATGQVDGAVQFDGSNDTIIMNDSTSFDTITAAITLSAWVSRDGATDDDRIISKRTNGGGGDIWDIAGVSDDEIRIRINDTDFCVTSNSPIANTATLYHVAATFNETTDQCYIYVNGVEVRNTTSTVTVVANNGRVAIAHRDGEDRWWDGTIDEVKVSNTDRSEEWIQTEYNNQSDPSSFVTFSQEDIAPDTQVRGGVQFVSGTRYIAN